MAARVFHATGPRPPTGQAGQAPQNNCLQPSLVCSRVQGAPAEAECTLDTMGAALAAVPKSATEETGTMWRWIPHW